MRRCAQQYLNQEQDESGEPTEEVVAKRGRVAAKNSIISFARTAASPSANFAARDGSGCPHDYIAFAKELKPLLENIHSETQHTGKFPKRAPHASQLQYRLIKLRSELRTAVDEEEYETAARIRDEIQSLEKEFESKSRGLTAGPRASASSSGAASPLSASGMRPLFQRTRPRQV